MKKNHIKTFVAMSLALLFFSTQAMAQLDLPSGSQEGTVLQRIGTTDIAITYSRPSVNDREIWGKLVPYGMNNLGFGTAKESPWRAGANENTIIRFTDDVKIEGQALVAGTYGLHMIVHENNEATIIFSTNSGAWGSYFYDSAEDALRVNVSTNDITHTEQLTYAFNDVNKGSVIAVLNWEKKQIPFKVEVDVTEIVLADIREKLQNTPGFNRLTWEQAARFSVNNGGDLEEALVWVDKAIAGQFFSQKTFANLALKAQVLMKMEKNSEAMVLLDEAAILANRNQLNALGYRMLTMEMYDKAVKYFKMNVKNNPKNANVYDSLGDAYKRLGEKKNAIKNLKKSLSLNPPENVKTNSIKLLKELGVNM